MLFVNLSYPRLTFFSAVEITRIRNAGGYVEYGRVNGGNRGTIFVLQTTNLCSGNLALSRAIGDFEFKKNHALPPEEQIITANPDVTEHQLTDEDEFLILACDGSYKYYLRR